jgi:hypothetical protein
MPENEGRRSTEGMVAVVGLVADQELLPELPQALDLGLAREVRGENLLWGLFRVEGLETADDIVQLSIIVQIKRIHGRNRARSHKKLDAVLKALLPECLLSGDPVFRLALEHAPQEREA